MSINQRQKRTNPEQHALSELRQAIWEASQWRTPQELNDYLQAVLREIERDEP